MWQNNARDLTFVVTLLHWITKNELLSMTVVAQLLGMSEASKDAKLVRSSRRLSSSFIVLDIARIKTDSTRNRRFNSQISCRPCHVYTTLVLDYLMGVAMIPNELSRLAINCVTVGDFATPVRIAHFVQSLFSAFQLLNLKNDFLVFVIIFVIVETKRQTLFDSMLCDQCAAQKVRFDQVRREQDRAGALRPQGAQPHRHGRAAGHSSRRL